MSRHGNKWNVHEVLSLQREYELLEWNVQQIADKHKRSVLSILHKLHAEGFTSSLFKARGYTEEPLKAVFSSHRKAIKRVFDQAEDEDDYLETDDDTSSDFEDDYQEDDSDSDDEDYVKDEELAVNRVVTKQADEVSDDISEVDKLTDRVWSLETSVEEIGTMVKSLFDRLVTTKSNKLQDLRKRAL